MLSFVHGDIGDLGQGGGYVNDGQRALRHHLADGQLFEETLAADQADLEAQLAALKAASKEADNSTDCRYRKVCGKPCARPQSKDSLGKVRTVKSRQLPLCERAL